MAACSVFYNETRNTGGLIMSFERIFTPFSIGNVEIKNRIATAPMGVCLNPGSNEINDATVAYFEDRAKGGFGLITSSPACIDEEWAGIADVGQYYLTRPEHVEGIRKIADAVHRHGAKLAIQLLHPGRQGASYMSNGQQPVAPSAIKEAEFDWLEMPRELSVDEIHSLVRKFVNGAKLAYEGGADGIELHGAHGYLINQFISPRANHRTDEYGGSFENNMRFIAEIIKGIQEFKPNDRFITARINATDFAEGGIEIDYAKKVALYLEELGIDAISITGGTYSGQDNLIEPQIRAEGWRTEAYLKAFKGLLHIPVLAANHIKRPATAEAMLKDGICDCVLLGRQSMADPNWACKAQAGKADQIRYCISCNHCTDQVTLGSPVKCSVNPRLSMEAEYNAGTLRKDGDNRRIVVIGGGPAGMEAALLASRRGFRVTLFEKTGKLGGSIALPRSAHGMEKVGYTVDGFISRIMASDVEIIFNTAVTSWEQIADLKPYAVIIAVGGSPARFCIPGIDQENVVQAQDVLRSPEIYCNTRTALVGSGMTGLETAEVLAANNCIVEIFEMQDEIAKNANMKNKYAVLSYITEQGVKVHLNHKLASIEGNILLFEDLAEGENKQYTADLVVLSMGVRPDKSLEEALKGKTEHLITVGDCADGRLLVHATAAAYKAVWDLR